MRLHELLNYIDPDNGVYIECGDILNEYFSCFDRVPIGLWYERVVKISGTATEHGECVCIEIRD